ncbi:hypothetical protein ACPPVU_11850 [Mucilaginibacter sp. McL0603]|uniref:hypothetical protein n=1 Tax=Mucilaginibacter sp. McL0603 TaxID=3415670 RepID=UPI003CEE0B55
MAVILLPQNIYEQFSTCLPDKLEEEISRASIRLKLQEPPKAVEERILYQLELDRLSGLKYLSQLRKGKLSLEDFNLKVELVAS